MAVKRTAIQQAIGLGDSFLNMPPIPIIARRDPTIADQAEIGTIWCNTVANTVWILASITAASSNWTTSAGSGLGIFTSVTVNPGDVDVTAGDVNIAAGNLNVTAGNASIGGDLTVAGTTTLNGDIDFTSSALIDLTSTLDAAPSILLHANGGTSEEIELHSDQGTSATSINIHSDVGGIALTSGRNGAGAIAITANIGGINITTPGAGAGEDINITATGSSVNISATENTADSITISSANGGIDIVAQAAAAGEDIDIASLGSSVHVSASEAVQDAVTMTASAGGINITASGAGAGLDIDLSAAASINLVAAEAVGDAITLDASNAAGGIVVTAGSGGVNIDAVTLINDSVNENTSINTGTSTGTVSIGNAAAGAITVDTAAGISLDGATASNFTVTGAGADLALSSVGGSVLVESTEDAALAIRLHANGGTSETIQLHSDLGTGVDSINLLSDVGGITLTATGLASDDAINLEAPAGGVDVDAALQINISSAEAAADAIVINASNAAGGIDLMTGGGEISIASSGNVTMVAATDTQASPSATAVINARVFKATFTGFTTASAGTQAFTITNSAFGVGDGVIVTVSNAGTNDAQMTLTRVNGETAGTIIIDTVNNGVAALNGNVVITGWIID